MRSLVPALLALTGCVYVSRTPAETDTVEVLDPGGLPVPEAWAVTWSENRTCPLGVFCWYPFGSLAMWPEVRSVSDVQLRRLTPRDNELTRPPTYKAYVNWGFLILPPGTYCESSSRMELFAAGCPWGFDGARARDVSYSAEPDHVRAARMGPVLDFLRDDPAVSREDLRDFAETLLKNLEQLGVREEGWSDVFRRLQALTK